MVNLDDVEIRLPKSILEEADEVAMMVVGSHLHQTATPESDIDMLYIWHSKRDDRRVFKRLPDTWHSSDSDHKGYSLRRFAELLAKGNPNIVEVVDNRNTLQYVTGGLESKDIRKFLCHVAGNIGGRPGQYTTRFFSALRGHIQSIKPDATPKQVAHGMRLALYGINALLSNSYGKFDYRKDTSYGLVRLVKSGHGGEDGQRLLKRWDDDLTETLNKTLETNAIFDETALKLRINTFFEGLR